MINKLFINYFIFLYCGYLSVDRQSIFLKRWVLGLTLSVIILYFGRTLVHLYMSSIQFNHTFFFQLIFDYLMYIVVKM